MATISQLIQMYINTSCIAWISLTNRYWQDDYKIVCFERALPVNTLITNCIRTPARTVDRLVRWHLRQVVLANVGDPGLTSPSSNVIFL